MSTNDIVELLEESSTFDSNEFQSSSHSATPLRYTTTPGLIDSSLRPRNHAALGSEFYHNALQVTGELGREHSEDGVTLPRAAEVDVEPEVEQEQQPQEAEQEQKETTPSSPILFEPLGSSQNPFAVLGNTIEMPEHDPLSTQHTLIHLQHQLQVDLEREDQQQRQKQHRLQRVLPDESLLVGTAAAVTPTTTTGQSSPNTTVSFTVQCPSGCPVTACTVAQTGCEDIILCKASCVLALCQGQSLVTAHSRAVSCDVRTKKAQEEAEEDQKELELQSKDFETSNGGGESNLDDCPTFVSGQELWNLYPFDQLVPGWNEEVMSNIVTQLEKHVPLASIFNTTLPQR
jgi:hypothetical protein